MESANVYPNLSSIVGMSEVCVCVCVCGRARVCVRSKDQLVFFDELETCAKHSDENPLRWIYVENKTILSSCKIPEVRRYSYP